MLPECTVQQEDLNSQLAGYGVAELWFIRQGCDTSGNPNTDSGGPRVEGSPSYTARPCLKNRHLLGLSRGSREQVLWDPLHTA